MEALVVTVQGSSSNAADLDNLLKFLKSQTNVLSSNVGTIMQAVHSLDPAQHSLGQLWLLETFSRLGGEAASQMAFIDVVSTLLQACSPPQIRLAPDVFVKLGRKYREACMAAGCPRKGILPLIAAVRALQPSSEYLTPLHAECFLLCLESKVYNGAAQLLSEDIFHVLPKETGGLTPRDLFLYCRYGSQLCCGRKQWGRAQELLMIALTAPALAANAIVMDCYKIHVLVSLISHGSVPPLPKLAPHVVRSMVEGGDCRPYSELASAYTAHNPSRVNKVVDTHAAAFAADGNLGLVAQVVSSLVPRCIQRLTATYLTLPLSNIASQVGLPNADTAEHHILGMVAAGEVWATISEVDGGMVRFAAESEGEDTYASADAARTLLSAVQQCVALSERLAATEHTLCTSREYQKRVLHKDTSRLRFDASGGADEVMGVTAPLPGGAGL